MTLRRVQVSDFRCLQSAEIEFDSQFTLISGPNASGKTSLLEAIYLLGRGRSFRTRRLDNLIRSGRSKFFVFGEVEAGERRSALGIEGSMEGIRARMGGEPVSSLADLAERLPVQIIDPEVHRLIEEGPSRRRRFIDWGVFHVEHTFVAEWQKYQHVLRQRNAALKLGQPRTAVTAWDIELVRLGDWIHAARLQYVSVLATEVTSIAQQLLGMELSLGYRSGWGQDTRLSDALRENWARDQEAGVTQAGPQRAELTIRLDGAPVKDRISRGQQKLLASALLLAQLRLFRSNSSVQPTLLLDDPSAELDGPRLHDLIELVAAQPLQVVVTSLSSEFSALGTPGRRYKSESGSIRPA